ncbi:G1 family glutamic endopeptidase [Longispora sp. K20-0274]|uniref:G1 family glutamic endopeptidase n=1 Tax=Longispora sp. K20-0274 TaxID=3088255 RepID=UPI00399C1695
MTTRIPGRRLALLAAVAAGLVAASTTPSPANAASPGTGGSLHPAHNRVHSDEIWGGYTAYGSTFHSISATWNIPALDCSANRGIASPWVGLDGWDSSTVEQIGIDFDCTTGRAQYKPWVEMYPQDSIYFTNTVRAGDSMTGSVTDDGGHWFTLTLTDSTQGWTKTFSKYLASSRSVNAEAIIEPIGGGNVPKLARFDALRFTDVTVDGHPIGDVSTHRSAVTRGTTTLATTGSLSGGAAFTVSWQHS